MKVSRRITLFCLLTVIFGLAPWMVRSQEALKSDALAATNPPVVAESEIFRHLSTFAVPVTIGDEEDVALIMLTALQIPGDTGTFSLDVKAFRYRNRQLELFHSEVLPITSTSQFLDSLSAYAISPKKQPVKEEAEEAPQGTPTAEEPPFEWKHKKYTFHLNRSAVTWFRSSINDGFTWGGQVSSDSGGGVRGRSDLKENGPVQVRGYYRKDGTYVRPHTRSRPRRR